MKKHNKKEKQYTEILHKEIELIQSCIERMSRNSFSCKGWNLTLQAGIFALVSENINKCHICIAALCVDFCFWWLDSYFLLEEQKYRDKYEWVIRNRLNGNTDHLYDLNPDNHKMYTGNRQHCQCKTFFSQTLIIIYGMTAALIIASLFYK